jgi:protein-disulfide isomerase-like protein with CxxC motif
MLNAFAKKHQDVTTLAVTYDSPAEAKKFAKRTKFSWRTVAGGKDLIEKVGIRAYPTFALLDPRGTLVAVGTQLEMDSLDKWVQQSIDRSKHEM